LSLRKGFKGNKLIKNNIILVPKAIKTKDKKSEDLLIFFNLRNLVSKIIKRINTIEK
jgi:hypothetical protein